MSNHSGRLDTEETHELVEHLGKPSSELFGKNKQDLNLLKDVSSQHESDGVSRVYDFGFQAWTRKSRELDPSHGQEDLVSLENIDTVPSEPDLAMELELAMHLTVLDDGKTFLPLGKIRSICRREIVRRELLRTFGEKCPDLDRYTNYVCGINNDSIQGENTSLKVFANLVLIDRVNTINDFMEAGIKDRDLPLMKLKDSQNEEGFCFIRRGTMRNKTPSPELFFNKWNRVEKRNFYNNQWRLLSPYFDKASDGFVGLYELDQQCIMPWIQKGEGERTANMDAILLGHFAIVTQYSIHPDHHGFDSEKFAIKEFVGDNDIPLNNEFKIFRRIETKKHLLSVYAAYRQGKRYSFIFPWADGGSLNDLWKREPLFLKQKVSVDTDVATDSDRTRKVTTWLACQLAGLTGKLGLGFLHDTKFQELLPLGAAQEADKLYGIHGDIKPENILYFEQDRNEDKSGLGLFKLSDFGLTGFPSLLVRFSDPPTGPHSSTYRAPECETTDAYLSIKYDIWSLGCVLLQFLTWFISGPDGLEKFDQERFDEKGDPEMNFKEDTFFLCTSTGDLEAKRSVIDHIKGLQATVGRENYLYDSLELIGTKMLKVDVEKRASCREVHQFLASSYEKCLRSRQYATARLPTFLEQGPSLDVETIESIRDDTTPPSITTEHPPPVLGSDTMSQIQSSSYPSVFDNDDSVTIYSVSDIPETRVEHYVSAFAEDLYKQMEVDGIHSELIEKSSIFLPTLLQAFAFTLAYELPSKSHREVMVFIHKYRHEIATAFKEKYQQPIGVEDIQPPVQQQRPTLIMERFLNSEASHARFIEIRDRPGSSGSSSVGSLPAIRDDVIQEDDIFSIPGMEEYVALISKAPGYEWLLSRLHREISLSRADHDSLRDIHDTILRAIPRNKEVSKKRSSYNARITYNIDWDILAFLRGQDYGEPDHEAISLAITITGSWTTCQALTARQYLEQTWPLTGLQTLKFLQQLLLNTDHDAKMTYDTPSHLELEGFFRSKMVIVTASGIPEFVAEVGEQLAWLGAALRPTDSTLDILPGIPYICVPHVLPAELHSEVHSEVPVLSCSIRFTAKRDKGKNTDQPGNCWRHLFHGPVIAGGFPIPNRAKENTGLEIPLDMLVALTRALYIDTFKSKVFIKGYNTMLVPIECSGSYLVWHLLYSNEPLQRISYLDGDDIRLTDVKLSDVPQYRHVLGWCADSVSTAGTIAAAHPIGKSGLSPAHANSVLEKVEIQAGQIVNVTAIFALGCREKPLHLTRPGYFDKLDWLLTSYFIFWDQGDRKGWLVTGASALLHILCGYLKNGQERYGANWLLDPDKLFNNADISNANYALNILMSERNRQLPLYTDLFVQGDEEPNRRPRYYTLQDKINHICSILEKSVDHQLDMRKSNGLTIKATPKRQLNGWDFRDLVISADPCSLRVANLETVGRGWTDLARELNAVTLFGKGFGELIRPKDSTHTRACRWSSVPSGSDYLVARVSDLHTIMDDKGDPNANPRVLIGDVHWHVEECTFQQCPCNGRQNAKHHEPVQRLFPRQVLKDWGDQPRINLEKDGAVIFGHTLSFPTHFRDSLRRKPKKLKSPFFKKWSLMKKAAKPG